MRGPKTRFETYSNRKTVHNHEENIGDSRTDKIQEQKIRKKGANAEHYLVPNEIDPKASSYPLESIH
jgi:hypothetical protein